mmetsp:Transcript_118550/g.335385  ORF Transcript_118550/g.335385 Transcript_118550/m.335385 type:complete len:351 (+) Transcript_118550:92-1144(+)
MELSLLLAASGLYVATSAQNWWYYVFQPALCRIVTKLAVAKAPAALGGAVFELRGVDLQFGRVSSFRVYGAVVRNLDPFTSECLLRLDDAMVAVDLLEMLRSRFGRNRQAANVPLQVAFELVAIRGCRIIVEKTSKSSNIKEFLRSLKQQADAAAVDVRTNDAACAKAPGSASIDGRCSAERTSESDRSGGLDLIMRRVQISGVVLEVTAPLVESVGGKSVKLKLPNIVLDNLHEKVPQADLGGIVQATTENALSKASCSVASLGGLSSLALMQGDRGVKQLEVVIAGGESIAGAIRESFDTSPLWDMSNASEFDLEDVHLAVGAGIDRFLEGVGEAFVSALPDAFEKKN